MAKNEPMQKSLEKAQAAFDNIMLRKFDAMDEAEFDCYINNCDTGTPVLEEDLLAALRFCNDWQEVKTIHLLAELFPKKKK